MEKVKVKEREFEVDKADIVPKTPDEEPTWYNQTAGILDKFRLIPRLIMLAYIFAFYRSVRKNLLANEEDFANHRFYEFSTRILT